LYGGFGNGSNTIRARVERFKAWNKSEEANEWRAKLLQTEAEEE
jgi:hypothetical protein